MTDDELRDKLIDDMIQNWVTMNNRPVERPDILRGLFEKGWSARGEHIAEHPKVVALVEAIKKIDLALTCPAAEYVPAISDAFTIIDNALKAFEEK
jgi:hypothetical protein